MITSKVAIIIWSQYGIRSDSVGVIVCAFLLNIFDTSTKWYNIVSFLEGLEEQIWLVLDILDNNP